MNQPKNSRQYPLMLLATALVVLSLFALVPQVRSQQTAASPSASASEKPYLVLRPRSHVNEHAGGLCG